MQKNNTVREKHTKRMSTPNSKTELNNNFNHLPASPLDLEKEHEKENTKITTLEEKIKIPSLREKYRPNFPKEYFVIFCDQN